MNEDKINLYCTILAYTQGTWTPAQVAEAFDFILSKSKTANMRLVKEEKDTEVGEIH
jgi:hypothetical protein